MKSSNKLSFRDRIARANSRGDFAAVFMMLPAVILLVVMSIYPFFWLFRYICYDYNGFNAYFTEYTPPEGFILQHTHEISCPCKISIKSIIVITNISKQPEERINRHYH